MFYYWDCLLTVAKFSWMKFWCDIVMRRVCENKHGLQNFFLKTIDLYCNVLSTAKNCCNVLSTSARSVHTLLLLLTLLLFFLYSVIPYSVPKVKFPSFFFFNKWKVIFFIQCTLKKNYSFNVFFFNGITGKTNMLLNTFMFYYLTKVPKL